MPLAPARVLLQHADQEVREVRLRRMPRNRKPFFESRRMRVHVFRREEAVRKQSVENDFSIIQGNAVSDVITFF